MAGENVIILLILASSPPLLNGMPGVFSGLRIINGSNAALGEFPFMAAMLYKGYFTCGGTILSEDWIVTAAHCVYDRDETQFSVVTGTNNLMDPDATETGVSQIIIHEDYEYMDNQQNDIALFKLSVALVFDSLTQPVTVSSATTDPGSNANVVVMGWGVNKYKGNPVQYLQKANIQIFSNKDCAASYGSYGINILPTNICAGTVNGGVGQCTGDSGGPVVVEGGNLNQTYQVGIVSFSAKPCGLADFPGVNTRLSKYIDWIQTMTGL